jgi:hypothetical protein
MITEENLIPILFQIGFRENEEYEIYFHGWEDKLAWKNGDKRYFECGDYSVEIDYKKDIFNLMGKPADNYSIFFSSQASLKTERKYIFNLLKREFKYEIRKILIKKIIQE